MDAKTPNHMLPMSEDKAAPAFVFRIGSQTGQNKTMEVSFGVPSDMTPQDLNGYVDKVMGVIDRQNDKGLLEVARLNLEGAEKQLMTNEEQKANALAGYHLEWAASQRRGDFKTNGQQSAQLSNWDKNSKHLREEIIPKFRKAITELENKINGA